MPQKAAENARFCASGLHKDSAYRLNIVQSRICGAVRRLIFGAARVSREVLGPESRRVPVRSKASMPRLALPDLVGVVSEECSGGLKDLGGGKGRFLAARC